VASLLLRYLVSMKRITIWTRPWVLNTALLVGMGLFVWLVPDKVLGLDSTLLVRVFELYTALWAKRDAKLLAVGQRERNWIGLFSSDWRVFWLVVLIWPIFFPLYISYRQRLIDGRIPFLPSKSEDPFGPDVELHQADPVRTDYVILVHGTFAAPKQGVHQWYELQLTDGFASKLNERLRRGPLGDAVLKGSTQAFFWSGDNTHQARVEGGQKLCSILLKIGRENPGARIHLVGHSHGGNVVLEAVRAFIALHTEHGKIPRTLGRVVFLGTPFYHKFWPEGDRLKDFVILPFVLLWTLLWSVLEFVVSFQYWFLAAGAFFVAWYSWTNGRLDLTDFYRSVEFWNWPSFVQTIAACLVAASCLSMFIRLKGARPIDSNIYFDVNRLTCGPNRVVATATFGLWKPALAPAIAPEVFVNTYQAIPRIKALVLTSLKFDEPLLALSAAPTVGMVIESILRSTLRPNFSPFPKTVDETYANYGGGNVFGELVGYAARVAVWILKFPFFVIAIPILRLTNAIYIRATARLLLRQAMALGFGLPAEMLSRWQVEASARIGVPLFFEECFVDLSTERPGPLLIDGQSSHKRQTDFGYLWDDELLRQRRQHSSWLLRSETPLNPADTRTALTIEDRLKEVADQLDLTHWGYYGVEDDCERIASFLERDQVEAQAASCLEDLRELPSFGSRMVPTNLVKYSTLLLVGLKLWGKSPVAHWPWVAVLLPYLVGAGGSMLVGLKLDEKAAGHIRRALSCTSTGQAR